MGHILAALAHAPRPAGSCYCLLLAPAQLVRFDLTKSTAWFKTRRGSGFSQFGSIGTEGPTVDFVDMTMGTQAPALDTCGDTKRGALMCTLHAAGLQIRRP